MDKRLKSLKKICLTLFFGVITLDILMLLQWIISSTSPKWITLIGLNITALAIIAVFILNIKIAKFLKKENNN